MNADDLLKYASTILSLLGAALVLYKSRKMLPAERASADAEASKQYAEAARMAAEQVTHALDRIAELEKRGNDLENNLKLLSTVLDQRDKCIIDLNEEIRHRDALIKDWMKGIRILIDQIRGAGLAPLWCPREWEDTP